MSESSRWLRRNPLVQVSWDRFGQIVLVDPISGREDPADVHMVQILGAFEVAKPMSMALDAIPQRSRPDLQYRILSLVEKGYLIGTDENPAARLKARVFAEYPPAWGSLDESFAKPSVHRGMLLDRQRLASFREAIQERVSDGMTVLEIGAGTGILSYFAVEAGAARVFAVEASDLAPTLSRIVAANGLEDRITVVHGRSTDVDLPQRADLLITETLGHVGIDEGILDTVADARARLLEPGAGVMPQTVELVVAVVDDPNFHQEHADFWNSTPYGLDLAEVRSSVSAMSYLTVMSSDAFVASPRVIATRDLQAGDRDELVADIDGITHFTASRSTAITGLLVWFAARLTPQVRLDGRDCSSWHQLFLPVDPMIPVQAGERLQVEVAMTAGRASARPTMTWSGHVGLDNKRSFRVTARGRS